MPRQSKLDPYKGYNFRLTLLGDQMAAFRECGGLDTSQDPIEYREGSTPDGGGVEPLTARKQPGLNKYANITLKWGVIGAKSQEIFEWRRAVQDGDADQRKDFTIQLLDDNGEKLAEWFLRDGWPTKWTGPTFNATDNNIAIESLEITHEGFLNEDETATYS